LTGAALFEALVYGKRPIATLLVTFRRRPTHSLHDYMGSLLPLKRLEHHGERRFFIT